MNKLVPRSFSLRHLFRFLLPSAAATRGFLLTLVSKKIKGGWQKKEKQLKNQLNKKLRKWQTGAATR
jgi:phosphoglycerate-specific signal transduction histidine kinase